MRRSNYIHNLSSNVKSTFKMGFVVPIFIADVVPGDVFRHKIHALIRAQALLAPLMHLVDIDMHAWFCPDRLIWDNATKFHSGGDDGLDTSVMPVTSSGGSGYTESSLADYLRYPTGVLNQVSSALPFRAYATIWNENYRDSQLQAKVTVSKADGTDTTTSKALLAPCWKRDYFTQCRPAPQLGPEVTIPLGATAPVITDGNAPTMSASGGAARAFQHNSGSSALSLSAGATVTGSAKFVVSGLQADLSAATGIDVRDLREGSAVQRYLEFNNVWGGRYIEQVWARFKTRVPDYRLDRPEFLGGGSSAMQFSEVLQTAEGTDPVGYMAGHGIALAGSNRYKYRVPEHGWIMVFLVIRPKTQYMQGLHRMLSRTTRYDYLLPEFVNIGDQAVLNKEIYAPSATPDGVFGYTPMYEEYRTIPSTVHGEFKSSLNYWHMAREFASAPALNSTFVGCNPTNRIWPVSTMNPLLAMINHTITAKRPLPVNPQYRLM